MLQRASCSGGSGFTVHATAVKSQNRPGIREALCNRAVSSPAKSGAVEGYHHPRVHCFTGLMDRQDSSVDDVAVADSLPPR